MGLRNLLNSLYGTYLLACMNAGGIEHYDTSVWGAKRSFLLALFVLPAVALTALLRAAPLEMTVGELAIAAAGEMLVQLVFWVGYLVFVGHSVPYLGCQERFCHFTVAFNWVQAVWAGMVLLIGGLVASGVADVGIIDFMRVLAVSAMVVFQSFVYHAALKVPVPLGALLAFFAMMFIFMVRSVGQAVGILVPL